MKGGKGGQGRKRGPARADSKGKPRGKPVAKKGKREFPAKVEKTTTRLGANRTEDDA